MIRIQNMTYSYERNIPVLRDITFTESEPVITVLWGRNGAGKTTLMKLLAGHLRPEQGSVEIMGLDPYNNEQAVRQVCYMQEEHPFGLLWTVRDALHFSQYFNPDWNSDAAERLLAAFRLDPQKRIHKLSKGMKSALQFIIGLASQAGITILDEPISGLDAAMRKKLYEMLLESHAEHPRLIILSTHHIEEMQPLCESLAVLRDGKLLVHEAVEKTRERGIWLVGNRDKVNKVITGQQVLEQSEAGSTVKVMLDALFSNEWKDVAQKHGLSIEKARMQDYLLNITDDQEVPV